MPSAVNRLIVAFDEPELSKALALGRQLRGLARYAKIGSIVFTAAGPRAIRRFAALGFSIFLDLKFHDIPSTVEKSCCAAARQGVSLLTVHACGQPQMLEAALAGARTGAREAGVPRPRVLGVTVLTSVGEGRASAITKTAVERALQARRMGLDGVVASPHEAAAIRRRIARPFLIVCPASGRPTRRRAISVGWRHPPQPWRTGRICSSWAGRSRRRAGRGWPLNSCSQPWRPKMAFTRDQRTR